MAIKIEEIYKTTIEHYRKAKSKLIIAEYFQHRSDDAISDVIPGFDADKLELKTQNLKNH